MSVSIPRVVAKEDYTVGWVCAIPVEMAAARGMLDETHVRLPEQDPADHNAYTMGQIQGHNVVIACLPSGMTGTTSAATVAKDMLRTFKSIRFGLMVGIGGGAPSPQYDIRLGDIVVSQPSATSGGVIQYDRGKALQGEFLRTGTLNTPPNVLLTALASLQAKHMIGETQIPEFLSKLAKKNATTRKTFSYPDGSDDCLFTPYYQHKAETTSTCYDCDREQLVQRKARDDTGPVIHYGNIASGNKVIKNAMMRDRLQKEHGVLCFEMEAAGLMLDFPCIVIRGISDYADSHKNDAWQGYAAATAAAFAKELLLVIPPTQVEKEKAVPQLVSDPELHGRISQMNESIKNEAHHWKTRYEDDRHIACHQLFKTSTYESLKNMSPDRVPGTCMWVLDHPRYKSWQQSSHDDLLWISADPGCGKSVLARSLVDNELRNTSEHTVCYFFFKDNAGQVSLATALCALLHQLFNSQPELIKQAMGAFEKNGKTLQNEVDEMWRILLAAAADERAHSVTCVLDALDECARNDQQKLIQLLTGFYSIQRTRSASKAHLKFLVTSRAYRNIEDGFSDIPPQLPSIRLAGEDRNSDISQEISLAIHQRVSEVANKLHLVQNIQDALLRKLQATPHRTYLWLYLVIAELCNIEKKTEKAIMRTIDSLPETVEEAYENILKKHNEKHREKAQILLHIIVGACRPLLLSEMDVAFQLATDSSDADDHDGLDLDKDNLESRLRHLCGLFVFVDDNRVYLIHQTAKEFLVAKTTHACSIDGNWKESIDQRLSNKIMTQICVQYLSFADVESIFDGPGREWNRAWSQYGIDFPFLRYSAKYWPLHISGAGVVNDVLLDEINKVLHDGRHPRFSSLLAGLWKSTNPFLTPRCSNDIHLSAFHRSTEILSESWRKPRQDLDYEDDSGQTALVLASSHGYNTIVEKLLVAGVNVNRQLKSDGRTALEAAISADHERTVELLLASGADIRRIDITHAITRTRYNCLKLLIDNGADINAEARDGWTPLMEASAGRIEAMVELLIESGADLNAKLGTQANALVQACELGDETIAFLLLSKGARINPPVGAFCSALGAAAGEGHIDIVRKLLENGADVNFTDHHGSTPLWEAAYHSRVFCLLLNNGANINASSLSRWEKTTLLRAAVDNESHIQPGARMDVPDEKGRTALYTASRTGNIEVIKFLLRWGASPNSAGNYGQTPIHTAAQRGLMEILALLHENGAALDVADQRGLAPIHIASYFRQLEAVTFLLNHGVGINARSNTRQTPLHAAAWKGHVDVVRLLLQRGANINSIDDVQRTPLYTAASKGHVDVVKILLERGADPSIRTLKNNTPLESAQHHGYRWVVHALLRHSVGFNE